MSHKQTTELTLKKKKKANIYTSEKASNLKITKKSHQLANCCL